MAGMRHQPQGRVVVDWGNPITRGLVDVFIPSGNAMLSLGMGKSAPMEPVGGAGIGASAGGLAATYGESAYHRRTSAPVFNLAEVTLLAVCTPADTAASATAVIAYGSSASNTPLLFMGQGTGGSVVNFRVRGNATSPDQEAAGAVDMSLWRSGQTSVLVGVRSARLDRQSIYCAGQQVGSTPYVAMSNATFNRSAIGVLLRSSPSFNWSGSVSLGLAFNRALSDDEVRSLTANPWQIFAAVADDDDIAVAAVDRVMSVEPAAISVAVGQVGMRVSRRLRVAPAPLGIAGGPVAMRAARGLAVESTRLALAGGPATLSVARRLVVPSAALVLTSGQVDLTYSQRPELDSYTLSVAPEIMALSSGAIRMRASRRMAIQPAALVLTGGGVEIELERQSGDIDISTISPSRIVVFEGSGSRVVVFEGSGSRVVVFEGSGKRMRMNEMDVKVPIKDGEKWVADRDRDEISWYGADITNELAHRNTTPGPGKIEVLGYGVEVLDGPHLQVVTVDGVERTFVVVLLGGIEDDIPDDWRWVARVPCMNKERFDKTTWFNEVDP